MAQDTLRTRPWSVSGIVASNRIFSYYTPYSFERSPAISTFDGIMITYRFRHISLRIAGEYQNQKYHDKAGTDGGRGRFTLIRIGIAILFITSQKFEGYAACDLFYSQWHTQPIFPPGDFIPTTDNPHVHGHEAGVMPTMGFRFKLPPYFSFFAETRGSISGIKETASYQYYYNLAEHDIHTRHTIITWHPIGAAGIQFHF